MSFSLGLFLDFSRKKIGRRTIYCCWYSYLSFVLYYLLTLLLIKFIIFRSRILCFLFSFIRRRKTVNKKYRTFSL